MSMLRLGIEFFTKGSSQAAAAGRDVAKSMSDADRAMQKLTGQNPSQYFDKTSKSMMHNAAAANQMSKAWEVLTRRANSGAVSIQALSGAFGGFSAITGVSRLIETADSMALLEQRAVSLTGSVQEGKAAFVGLYQVAQRSGLSIQDVGQTYTRMAPALEQLGVKGKEAVRAVETLGKVIQASGVSVQQANAGMMQFAQGLSSGKLAGDEFRSIAENTPAVLKLMAKELNVTYGELRKMSSEGKITDEVMTKFLTNIAGTADAQFKALPETVGKSLNRVSNAFAMWLHQANQLDKGGSFTATLAQGLNKVAANMDTLINVVGLLALAFGGRLVGSMLSAAKASAAYGIVSGRTAAETRALTAAMDSEAKAALNTANETNRAANAKVASITALVQERTAIHANNQERVASAAAALQAAAGTDKEAKARQNLDKANAAAAKSQRLLNDATERLTRAQYDAGIAHNRMAEASGRATTAATAMANAQNNAGRAARLMGAASQAAGALVGALGGPIGIAITALTALALNWDNVGDAAGNAALKAINAAKAIQKALDDIEAGGNIIKLTNDFKDSMKELAEAKAASEAATQRTAGGAARRLWQQDTSSFGSAAMRVLSGPAKTLFDLNKEFVKPDKGIAIASAEADAIQRRMDAANARAKATIASLEAAGRDVEAATLRRAVGLPQQHAPIMKGENLAPSLVPSEITDQINRNRNQSNAEFFARHGKQTFDVWYAEWEKGLQREYGKDVIITPEMKAAARRDWEAIKGNKRGGGGGVTPQQAENLYESTKLSLIQAATKAQQEGVNLQNDQVKGADQHVRATKVLVENHKASGKLTEAQVTDLMELAKAADAANAALVKQQTELKAQQMLKEAMLDVDKQMTVLAEERAKAEGKVTSYAGVDRQVNEFFNTDEGKVLSAQDRMLYTTKLINAENERWNVSIVQRMVELKDAEAVAKAELSTYGLIGDELERANQLQAVRIKYEQLGRNETEARREQLKTLHDEEIRQINAAYDLRKARQADWRTGVQMAMKTYMDDAANSHKQFSDLATSAAKSFEDVWTNAIKTGKLSFDDFKNTLIAGFAQIMAQKATAELMGSLAGIGGKQAVPYGNPKSGAGGGNGWMGTIVQFIGGLFSASDGFDVPKGMNPLTQLHSNEMVLPSKYADVIRDLASNGGGGSQGNQNSVTINISAPTTMDRKSLDQTLAAAGNKMQLAMNRQG